MLIMADCIDMLRARIPLSWPVMSSREVVGDRAAAFVISNFEGFSVSRGDLLSPLSTGLPDGEANADLDPPSGLSS